MDEIDQEAQDIARSTRRERHHSTCKLSSKGSRATKTCNCWVFHNAKTLLLKDRAVRV